MCNSQKLVLSFLTCTLGVLGVMVTWSLAFFNVPLSLLGLGLFFLGTGLSAIVIYLSFIWRNNLIAAKDRAVKEKDAPVGERKNFRPDEERWEAIRRTQYNMRDPGGVAIEDMVMTAITASWIYYDLLKDIADRIHGDKALGTLIHIGNEGSHNALITHTRDCPDCQKLLGYVITEIQKNLPAPVESGGKE